MDMGTPMIKKADSSFSDFEAAEEPMNNAEQNNESPNSKFRHISPVKNPQKKSKALVLSQAVQ